jgi:hypothetical protein
VGFRPRSFFSSGAPPRLGASQHRTQDTSCPSSSEPRTAPRGFAFSYRRCPFSYTTRAPCRRVIRAAGQRHGCPVGRHRHLEVVHASDLLNDAVAGLVPDVHTKVKCVLVAPSKLLARADEVIELATHLLRCICRLLAQNGQTETDRYLSAFGAKRTCRESRKRFGLTRVTHSGRSPA